MRAAIMVSFRHHSSGNSACFIVALNEHKLYYVVDQEVIVQTPYLFVNIMDKAPFRHLTISRPSAAL